MHEGKKANAKVTVTQYKIAASLQGLDAGKPLYLKEAHLQ